MTTQPNASPPYESLPQPGRAAHGGATTWAAAAVLAISIGAVYFQSLHAPFIFDDNATVLANESIGSLWPLFGTTEHPGPLRPPAPLPTAGRPVVNLSLAINYFVGDTAPIGYHIVNSLIHLGSSLLLFAITRRTLQLPYFAGRFAASAGWLALAVSLLWSIHPLQTEAVVYTTQRTELLMACFYLATLYCSLRYWTSSSLEFSDGAGEGLNSARPNYENFAWLALAVCACLAGMASKEVMVSAPVIVLLFDRTFISGSLMKAMRRSWPLYVGLASTWLLLLALNLNSPRGDSAGFHGGPSLISWWLTQCQVLLMYFKLAIWPSPLLLHYQLQYLETFGQAWMYVAPVLLLGVATLVLLWRNSPVGFLGVWVFAILAPTTVVPILTEVAAERRMYLPLAALLVLFVLGCYSLMQFVFRRSAEAKDSRPIALLPRVVTVSAALLVAIVLAIISVDRLHAYNEPIVLWRQVVQHQPNDFVAHGNLGGLLVLDPDCQAAAIEELQSALKLKPEYLAAMCNLGLALTNTGQYAKAIETLHKAITLQPKQALGHNNLGLALLKSGRLPEAVDAFLAAKAIEPDNFQALNNLGLALTEMGRPTDAIEPLELAVNVDPKNADAHNNLGRALTNAGRLPEAIRELRTARTLTPNDALVLNNLGFAFSQAGDAQEAISVLEQALKIRPDFALAHNNLAIALFGVGKVPEATEHFRLAIKFNSKDANAHANLANILANSGDLPEAISQYQQAIELQPDRAEFHKILADLERRSGHAQRAIDHYQAAIRLQSDFTDAYFNLVPLLAQTDKSKEAIAAAEKAIALARASNQQEVVEQVEEWLKHYQTELRRAEGEARPGSSSPPTPPAKPK